MFFSIYSVFVDISGHYLKVITKFMYERIFKKTKLPILGRGIRPDGAKYCSSFIFEDNLKGLSTSYGMPSGHSIIALMAAMFWSLYIIDNQPIKKRWIGLLVLNFTCLTVAFSRIYLGCHTLQQVIVGGLIGCLFGYIGYKLYQMLNLLKLFKYLR